MASLMVIAMALTDSAQADVGAGAPMVQIQDCWIRALPGRLPSAAYFRLRNPGDQPAVLAEIRTSAYTHVMLHATRTEHGMSRMVHAGPVTVPANGVFDFSPGGHHVMLEQPRRPIQAGDRVALQFRFQTGPSLEADCIVRPPDALP